MRYHEPDPLPTAPPEVVVPPTHVIEITGTRVLILPMPTEMCISLSQKIKFHGRPVSAFAESKISRSVRIPPQDSAERAFNKLARTFAAQVETLKRRGGDAVAGGPSVFLR